MQAATVYAFSA